jgi:hypothetical protein
LHFSRELDPLTPIEVAGGGGYFEFTVKNVTENQDFLVTLVEPWEGSLWRVIR